ncbi:MAG: thioredoxin family protein [Fuerstiella sp.]|nr:thioredoxin family protein [Fuerstiella sp.]
MFRTTFFVGMLCILSGTHVNAQTRPAPPKIGDVAPEWKNLVGTDDQKHSLAHLADASVVVLVFTSNSCPYSVDYEDRTIALKKKYADTAAGVEVVAINSNAFPEDELDKMKQRAAKKQFNFPYLRDDSQDVARAYGAVYTPEFYVLDRSRRIIYRGALDDSTDAEKVSVSYIDLAIEAAIAGKLPEVTTTGARGCTIRFRRRRR